MHWVYYFIRFLTKALLLLLTRWRVLGKENIPAQGPLLIVANHLGLADPAIIGASIRRKIMFMAKEELFHARLSSYFIRNYGAFPVRRGGLNRKTLYEAEQWLRQGYALVMFPEGGRSPNQQLQPAFAGSALIASRLGVPILPVGLTGTEHIHGLGWCLRRPEITITIGHPFPLPSGHNKLKKEERAQLTNAIMERIAELLPPKYRGKHAGEEHQR